MSNPSIRYGRILSEMASASDSGPGERGGSRRISIKKREVVDQTFFVPDDKEDGAKALEMALQELSCGYDCESGKCFHKEEVAELKKLKSQLENEIRRKGVRGEKLDEQTQTLKGEVKSYQELELTNENLLKVNSDLEAQNKVLRETLQNAEKKAGWKLDYHLSAKVDSTYKERLVDDKLLQTEKKTIIRYSSLNNEKAKAITLERQLKKVDADISDFLDEALQLKAELDEGDFASATVPIGELKRQLLAALNTLEEIIKKFKTESLLRIDIVNQLEEHCGELREFEEYLSMLPMDKMDLMCVQLHNCGKEIEWYEDIIRKAGEGLSDALNIINANDSKTSEQLLGDEQTQVKAVEENFRVEESGNASALTGLSKKLKVCRILFSKLHDKFERLNKEFFSIGVELNSTFTEVGAEESIEVEIRGSEQSALCTSCQRDNIDPEDTRRKQLASQTLREFTYLLDSVERDMKRINQEELRGEQKDEEPGHSGHC